MPSVCGEGGHEAAERLLSRPPHTEALRRSLSQSQRSIGVGLKLLRSPDLGELPPQQETARRTQPELSADLLQISKQKALCSSGRNKENKVEVKVATQSGSPEAAGGS